MGSEPRQSSLQQPRPETASAQFMHIDEGELTPTPGSGDYADPQPPPPLLLEPAVVGETAGPPTVLGAWADVMDAPVAASSRLRRRRQGCGAKRAGSLSRRRRSTAGRSSRGCAARRCCCCGCYRARFSAHIDRGKLLQYTLIQSCTVYQKKYPSTGIPCTAVRVFGSKKYF